MDYFPLNDLFNNLLKAPVAPDVLVLMGPFVSVNHPVVKTGYIPDNEAGEDGNETVSGNLATLNPGNGSRHETLPIAHTRSSPLKKKPFVVWLLCSS